MIDKLKHCSTWIGITLILAVGIIHLSIFTEEYGEAHYLGVMFLAAFVGAVVAAIGIYREQTLWGWMLGAFVALGSILGYVLSRTVGLPVSGIEPWGPPIGYASLVLEIIFVVLSARATDFRRLVRRLPSVVGAQQIQGRAGTRPRTGFSE